MVNLEGRTAIVTGAARGLGRAHALRLAELGANIVVNDNGAPLDGLGADDSPAQAVVDEIVAAGGHAVAHIGSVADWNSAAELVRLAVETFDGLHILVNNAGIVRDRTIVRMSEAEFTAVIDVHLKGHFTMLHHCAVYWRGLAKAGRPARASVINTSSGSGLRGNPGQVNYASAKAGIAAMTLVAAQELARYDVRVNAISPVARTRMTVQTPGWENKFEVATGAFDMWLPENIAPLVAWLASAECHVSGQVLSVVGGHVGWQQGWVEKQAFDVGDRKWTEDELGEALADLPSGVAFTPTA